MSTAISIIENTANAVDFRKEMNVIHDIVGECEREIALMNQVHDFVYSGERVSMINRLQVLSASRAPRPVAQPVHFRFAKGGEERPRWIRASG